MADELSNFTIFRLSGNPSLEEIIGSFKGFPELAAPVALAQGAGLPLYTILPYKDKELPLLPVFTAPGLLEPPYAVKPALAFLQLLFASPSADVLAFNPRHAKAKFSGAEVRLDKRQLSAVIGFLQTPSQLPAGEELDAALKNEAGFGNLHRANYMASVLLGGQTSAPPCGAYAETLISLGLLQEAYDYVKAFQTPDFFCYMASILRLSGDPAKARQWLEKIPPGTPFEDKKRLELAWLALEENRTGEALDAFRSLARNSFEKTGALFGTGVALAKSAQPGQDPAGTGESLAAFSAALNLPSPMLPDIFIQMGNLNFRGGNYAEAGSCYRKAAELRPTVQAKANLCLTLLKTGKFQEAAALINELALTDLSSAGRLASQLSPETALKMLEATRQHQDTAQPDLPPVPPARPPARPAAAPAAEAATVSLEAAKPRNVISGRTPRPPESAPAPAARQPDAPEPAPPVMESLMDAAGAAPMPTEAETRKDDFMGRAFKLASMLEEEFNRKMYFNADGLAEAEKKLRLTFMQARQNPQDAIETVKDCAAFLCFLLQERHKGRLIKMPDFDHWGWPVVFEVPRHLVTYPIQRTWKLLWQGEEVPEPGWLAKYLHYLEDELKPGKPEKPQGADAVQRKIMSHPERLIDMQTEHRRIMILVTSLDETRYMELGRSGIVKMEKALKTNFRPDIPPTADGWKLLRCYGHILAEIMKKDFKANWYNADGNDGLWSMQLPWRTFIFPIGKIYKAASTRESLTEYYDFLLSEKLKITGGTL